MKIVATVEARMGSGRLPGKVLLPACGKPMLQHLIDRLKRVSGLDEIVLATTKNAGDDILEEFSNTHNISCFRGSEEDVLGRVVGAAEEANAEILVTITGDCPIIDEGIVSQCIDMFIANNCDYCSNVCKPSYPIGMDVQVMLSSTLKKVSRMTQDPLDREHVTWYIRNNPKKFKQLHLIAPAQLYWPELGLTLDEERDYKLLCKVIDYFSSQGNSFFNCYEVVSWLREHLDLVRINADVFRKT